MQRPTLTRTIVTLALGLAFAAPSLATETPLEHPLEPPDRTSPRATISTFLDSIDTAWSLFSSGDPAYQEPFLKARNCLDLSEIPPLVFREASGKAALVLKEVLDRLDPQSFEDIPDAEMVEELGLTRWTIPHTEITLLRTTDGERQGDWLFSKQTVARTDDFYQKVQHLPLRPGRLGGHVEELRAGTRAVLLLKMVEVMPSWFKSEVGGMFVWQWFGLALLVVLLTLAVAAAAWLGRRWADNRIAGRSLAPFLVPLALVALPLSGGFMIRRIFMLPGAPAMVLRLVFSIVGSIGLAWLVALLLTRVGELVVAVWFREARPLKKQLVRVIFRIASIVVVTGIALTAAQRLGVPVAGLIAGLGVGGLAIALAAQGTLENFIGGIILYADQPVKVGDICKFGTRRGTVEDVGLRSVKIRTLDRTIVTVPNADFAKLQLENLTERDLVLLREKLCLRYETTREQIKEVLAGLEAMLEDHPRITEERLRVRLTGFGEYSLEVEIFAYALTREYPEFLEIREEVLLEAMAIVESAGTRLALPTEIHYEGGQAASVGRSETAT
jgi:MscS family membrane protein